MEAGVGGCGVVFDVRMLEEEVMVLIGVLPTVSFVVLPLLRTCMFC